MSHLCVRICDGRKKHAQIAKTTCPTVVRGCEAVAKNHPHIPKTICPTFTYGSAAAAKTKPKMQTRHVPLCVWLYDCQNNQTQTATTNKNGNFARGSETGAKTKHKLQQQHVPPLCNSATVAYILKCNEWCVCVGPPVDTQHDLQSVQNHKSEIHQDSFQVQNHKNWKIQLFVLMWNWEKI